MTLPHEEIRAVEAAGKMLGDLLDRSKTPGVPKGIRARASAILRHFPSDIAEIYRRAGVDGLAADWFWRRTRGPGKK